MWTPWKPKKHLRCRRVEGRPVVEDGWTVTRKKASLLHAETLQFVTEVKELETTDVMGKAHLFNSEDSAWLMADRMNGFEKRKREWINEMAS